MTKRTLVMALGVVGLVAALAGFGYLDSQALAQEPVAVDSPRLSPNMDSDHFGLNWNVRANGGSTMSSSHFRLSSTVGQTAVVTSDSTHFSQRAGYWQSFLTEYGIYLPVVVRGS
ncbi:MAG: hypothetical protein KAS81_01790 [Anaerolineales bacterium]|jgi:hypothetical protein|nr:hypothetical protein [Anaerolineales bacterium]